MAIFEVRDTDGKTHRNDVNAYLCVANDSAAAKRISQAETSVSPSLINAVVTEMDPNGTQMSAAGALIGWRFRIAISDGSGVSVEGDATNDTLDEVGSALAAALNALPAISNAQYTAASQTLRVAEGATDALGDQTVVVSVFPPIVSNKGGQINSDVDQSPSFVSSITHEGASSADLTVVFKADTTTVPQVLWTLSRP